jgi:hypothetical protein
MDQSKVAGTIMGVFFGVLLVLGLSLLFNYPIMWMMNYTFSSSFLLSVFGVSQLTFWKTMGLSVLCGQLIRGSVKGEK